MKENVCQLRLAVDPGPAVLPFRLEVIKVDGSSRMDLGSNIHDSGGGVGLEQVHQQPGEVEVGQVVHRKLHLQPILGDLPPARDHGGVVQENVQITEFMVYVSSQSLDRRRVGEVSDKEVYVFVAGLLRDYLPGLPTSPLISADHEDSGPEPGKANGGGKPDARVGPRYQYSLVFHILVLCPLDRLLPGEDTR